MNEKKNIDRLFQEKFKDFEVTPPDFVWQNLETELLEKKKKRRILPLWFRLSGVAAILVMGFFIAMPFMDNAGSNANPVVIDTKTNPDGSTRISPTDNPVRQSQSVETAVAAEEAKAHTEAAGFQNNSRFTETTNTGVANIERDKGRTPAKNRAPVTTEAQRNYTATSNEAVVQNNTNKGNRANAVDNNTLNNTPGSNNGNDNQKENGIPGTQQNEGIAVTTDNKGATKGNNAMPQNERPVNVVIPVEINKNEAIVNNDAVTDTASTIMPENELEILRKKLQEDKDPEKAVAEAESKNKWNIKPQMAPLFFNTASQGSPIDAELAANSKNFDNDLSYGVGINYALTDKITIRSGINTVNMKYATNDVAYYATLDTGNDVGFTNTNVSPEGGTTNLVIGTPEVSAAGTGLSIQQSEGSLVQKIGFVEVPLEMSYKLINSRFGVDLIGGVSTMFLNDNNVSLISEEGYSSSMGEANNLNKVSFTTNVGIGFRYRIFDSFEASFEPTFKYQLNTFNGDAGNFKPYFIGLYSGVSFSF